MRYNREKQLYEFGEEGAKQYVDNHKEKSLWNETQLTLVVEVLVNNIDIIVEVYKNYPGNILYLLKHLYNSGENGVNIKGESEFMEFRHELYCSKSRILSTAAESILTLKRICSGNLYSLKLHKLQAGGWIKRSQVAETHQIAKDLLGKAIKTVRQSKSYEQAAKEGRLYFSYPPVSKEYLLQEAKDNQRSNLKAKVGLGVIKHKKRKIAESPPPHGVINCFILFNSTKPPEEKRRKRSPKKRKTRTMK